MPKSKRVPSLHITEDKLVEVFQEVFKEIDPFEGCEDPDYFPIKVAKLMLQKAKAHSVSTRNVIASNKKLKEKTDKIQVSGRSEAGLFAQILLMTRRKMQHKGIHLIEPTSPDWPGLKETCSFATEFCNEFGLPIKTGYIEYLKIGVAKMKNFSMYKFKNMHAAICKHFESTQEVESDPTPEKTKELYTLYIREINIKLGWAHDDYKDNPDKYVCFVRAKILAMKFNIQLKHYMKAQFVAMEWGDRSVIPDPFQLYGDKAMERVRKYAYENNITINKKISVDFKKLRK